MQSSPANTDSSSFPYNTQANTYHPPFIFTRYTSSPQNSLPTFHQHEPTRPPFHDQSFCQRGTPTGSNVSHNHYQQQNFSQTPSTTFSQTPLTTFKQSPPSTFSLTPPTTYFHHSNNLNHRHQPAEPISIQSSPLIKPLSTQSSIKQKPPPSRHKSSAESQSSMHGPCFERQDYLNIIEYLSNPKNYNLLFGAGKKTEVKGQSMGITGSWDVFATHINSLYNQRTKTNLMALNGNDLRQRFVRYRRVYALAKRNVKSTGSGCTDQDRSIGINTNAVKDESNCPCYEEMDALFGEKANITAMDEMDSTVVVVSDCEDSDYDYESDSVRVIESKAEFQESKTDLFSGSLSRTSTLANLIDGGIDGRDGQLSSGAVQTPGLNPDLDGVFQPLRSTVENLNHLMEDPSDWDNIPIPNNLLSVSNQLPSEKPNLGNSSVSQPSNNDQPNLKKNRIPKRQSKTKDKSDSDSATPKPPITAPAKSESKNPLAQALLTISQSKAQMYEASNKQELDIEARMVENEAKRLMREISLDKHKKEQEEKREKQEALAVSLQLAWDKEKFIHQKEERMQDKRIEQMNRWLAEGKSVADVGILLEMSGLAQVKETGGLAPQQ